MSRIKKTKTCWIWKAGKIPQGYGAFYAIKYKRNIAAHRYSYQLFKGKIPKGMLICHSCDNPPCVNPDHLWAGTQRDNVKDCLEKGRRITVRGEKNGVSKLTEKQVIIIKSLKGKQIPRIVGEKFGVTRKCITKIWHGKTWKHII